MTTTKFSLKALAQVGTLLVAFTLAAFIGVGAAHADSLYRQLEEGNSGADVSLLQTFLAKDRTIYPQGLVTGYFGSLTKSAVSNFQSRNGIATVGRVGPVTMVAINAQMNGSVGGDVRAPIINTVKSIPGTTGASIEWSTNEPATGIVYYSTAPLSLVDTREDVTVSGMVARNDTVPRTMQSVNMADLAPNTTYYFVVYSRDASGNVQMTWPATFRTTN